LPKKLEIILKKHLEKLKIKSGENILLVSNLLSFRILDLSINKKIYNLIINMIGRDGNIALTNYNFEFKKKNFYQKNKLYKNKNSLNKYFYKRLNLVFSDSILHNHLLYGPLRSKFKNRKCYNSFGQKSDFDFFKKNSFNILLLGTDGNESCTYIHHLEQLSNVPYRSMKEFIVNLKVNKKIKQIKIEYPINKKNTKLNLNKLFFHKKLKDKLLIASDGFLKSYKIKIKDLHNIGLKILTKNKNLLVK